MAAASTHAPSLDETEPDPAPAGRLAELPPPESPDDLDHWRQMHATRRSLEGPWDAE